MHLIVLVTVTYSGSGNKHVFSDNSKNHVVVQLYVQTCIGVAGRIPWRDGTISGTGGSLEG